MQYNPEKLRTRAIEILGEKSVRDHPEILKDIDKLVEEYNIYKIELDLQQEELSKTNQELEQQNRKLDDLFENAPVAYFILDGQGVVSEINTTALNMLQCKKEHVFKKSFTSIVHPSSQDHFYFFWQKVTGEKCSANVEIALLTDKQQPEYFLINSQPYQDEKSGQWFVRLSATNVSELKEAEVLRDSERRYRLLFKNMINGLLVLKPQFSKTKLTGFQFFRANASFEQITGLNSRAMEDAPLLHIFPDRGAEILPVLRKTVLSGSNQKIENFPLKDDVIVNIYSFIPEQDYVALILEDVTAQVIAEKEQYKSHEMLQTIFKILPVGVTITDIKGNIIDCNPSSEALLGLKKKEHLVRNFAGNDWAIIRKDFSRMPAEEFASVRALKENRIVENVEMGIVKQKDPITWINVSAAPIPLPELGVAIVYSDITEKIKTQEETEEKFKHIIQNSTDAIIIVDSKGSIIEWNKGCELIFGFRRNEVIGQKIWSFIEKVSAPEKFIAQASLFGRKNIESALKTGDSEWFKHISETEIADIHGKQKTIQSQAFPVKAGQSYLMGVVARDISETKDAEKMLKMAKEQAEEASLIKSQFLANISHEIRTPLNAIMGFTEILREFPVYDQKFKSLLSGIKKSSKALMGLINDILDLSSIEAGKMVLNPTTFSIANLIEDVRQIFSLKAEQKGLIIKVVIDPKTPPVILLDELRIRQILFNLVGNAVKFTQYGGIRIEVKTKKTPHLKNCIDMTLKVIDTGPGIQEKDLKTIFDPFFQKSPDRTVKQEGTGLGLSISRRFAEMMNGSISVQSSPGKGTTFSVYIPGIPSMKNQDSIKIKAPKPTDETRFLIASHQELSASILRELTQRQGSVRKAREFMQKEIWPEYDKIADILGFDEVVRFSSFLLDIAHQQNLRYLKEFSIKLNRKATSFDVIEINQMLSSFETIRQ